MTDSALVGQPPANARDLAIVKGMLVLAHLTGKWPPEKGSPPSPSWPPVNERNMDSTQMPIIVSSICAMVIVALITGTRVLSRTLQKRRALGWDDTFIIMATLFLVGYLSLVTAQSVNAGHGKRSYNLTYADKELSFRIGYLTGPFLLTTQGCIKLSIICFNARLTGPTSKTWMWLHRFLFVVAVVYTTLLPIFALALARPVLADYSYIIAGKSTNFHFVPDGHLVTYTMATIWHIVFDWILLSIPTIIIFRLQMPLARKLRCIVPLSIGCLSCLGASYALKLVNDKLPDSSYDFIKFCPWRFLDLSCGVIATSLPALATLIEERVPESWRRYHGSDRSTPKIYIGDHSNPFSKRAGGTSTSITAQRTYRDKYDEIGVVNVTRDIEMANSPRSSLPAHDSERGSQSQLHHPEAAHVPKAL